MTSTPLLDDAARLLITLCYQRQVCSMTVLADLLEVTATCIGDTVNQTREALQDHSHPSGAAPVRFPTAQALHAFLDTDTRPTRTQIHKAAVPPSPDQNQPPRPAATHRTARTPATSPGRAPQLPAAPWPRQAGTPSGSSTRRSATANASLWPSSPSADCARWTSSPTCSRSAGPRSATPSARPARSSNRPGTHPHRHQPATAPPPNSWPW